MNNLRILFTIATISFTTLLSGQDGLLLFSLQKLSDISWGVFVKPDNATFPSGRTSAGSGQVTIVAPADFDYENMVNHSGTWAENARVVAPQEATDKTYISFGFVNDNPQIQLIPNEETLLFTFTVTSNFDNTFFLFDNETDVFATPNSKGSNPGNDIGMLDFGTGKGMVTYQYGGNYNIEKSGALAVMVPDEVQVDEEEDEDE